MARVDKTESAIGVVRAVLDTKLPEADLDTVIGVGINAAGNAVRGAGKSGVIGVMNPSKHANVAGKPIDIFVLADIVDCEGLTAGTKYYSNAAGDLVTAAEGNTYVGFTVEADRLLIRL